LNTFFNWILRAFAFLFHLPVALFLFGLGLFAWIDEAELQLTMLPWTGKELTYWILWLGAGGVLFWGLALRKRLRALFAVYALGIWALTIYAVFFSRHVFDGASEFKWALGLNATASLAALGAVLHAIRKNR
jgi:hypothetical protein